MRFLLSLSIALMLFSAGCGSNPNRTAYVAVGSAIATVDASIKAFHIYTQTHPLSKDQEQQYANVLNAYVQACELVRASKTASGVSGPADPALEQKADEASAALVSFMNSIAPMIVKGNKQ